MRQIRDWSNVLQISRVCDKLIEVCAVETKEWLRVKRELEGKTSEEKKLATEKLRVSSFLPAH